MMESPRETGPTLVDLSMDYIPVTLLTGFLGSGKSTLLTQILTEPEFEDTAVVVNEFGEVGLDGFLVEHSDDQVVEMTTGCLCCTIRGDIRETLLALYGRREKGEIPAFRRLIVESTGLADPAPVIHTLLSMRYNERDTFERYSQNVGAEFRLKTKTPRQVSPWC